MSYTNKNTKTNPIKQTTMSNDFIRLADDHPLLSQIPEGFTPEEKALCVRYESIKYLNEFNRRMNKNNDKKPPCISPAQDMYRIKAPYEKARRMYVCG